MRAQRRAQKEVGLDNALPERAQRRTRKEIGLENALHEKGWCNIDLSVARVQRRDEKTSTLMF